MVAGTGGAEGVDDSALRLARYFRMSPEFWLGLQMDYDLDIESDRLGNRLEHEVGEYRES